jgi:hypothetical protein
MSDIGQIDDELIDDVGDDGDHNGASRGRGSLVTVTTVIGLLLATALTILGVGTADSAVTNFDSTSWLFSSSRGEMDRVNGVTAKVDTRSKVKDTQNHELQVTQTDRYLILRDLTTGQVSTMDLTTLQVSAVLSTAPGLGVTVALHDNSAFIIDTVQGQVRQLDPRTLAPTGDSLTFPPGLTAGTFDGKGVLWLAVPSEGTVVGIKPGANGGNPTVVRTVPVTTPNHDLELTVLDDGVAVLDNTVATVTTVRGTVVVATSVPIDQPAAVPVKSSGGPVAVTVAGDRKVVVVNGDKVGTTFTVPGTGDVEPAVAFAGHFYCADNASSTVYEFDGAGKLVNQIHIASAGGNLELEVREDHLFINAPNGSSAVVVDENHKVTDVDKFNNNVTGGDPPPPAKTPPPAKPAITAPGKPQNFTATAGNTTVHLTWKKAKDNGAPITQYVIEGGGQKVTVGAKLRAVDITGLTNGTKYTFTIYAVNKKGNGPKATSKTVIPTSQTPDAPTNVHAVANKDGTVDVTWDAANGQGHKIKSYTVTAISGGAEISTFSTTGVKFAVPDGALTYGTQYAFTVIAVNDIDTASQPSALSETVTPFNKPSAVKNLTASTSPNQKGAIQVDWNAADDNGSAITKYTVDDGSGTPRDVTGTSITLNGYGDDQAVQVSVVATNDAGVGPAATATARTMGQPTITWTSDQSDYKWIQVTFTPNNKNGSATCALNVAGVGTAQAACTTQPVTLTVNGVWPNNTYNYTVSVTNAAGSASVAKSKATLGMRFTVICPNPVNGYCGGGIWAYQIPYQTASRAIAPSLSVGTTGIPFCQISGGNVNASPWGGKNNAIWLQFSYKGQTGYFPDAWASLDGGDNLANLPAC